MPSAKRDEFPKAVQEALAKRVGYRCSCPTCERPTSGPNTNPLKAVSIGVAAHVTAAAPGGPRYDPALTREQRRSIENGIWLCQTHATLVDTDEARYPVSLIRIWKGLAEETARLSLECSGPVPAHMSDVELVRFYAQCFDRPAFQDPFRQEGSVAHFERAVEDTLTALNTGCLRSRDGTELARARGKAYLANPEWRDKLDAVADLLRAIRSRLAAAKRRGEVKTCPHRDDCACEPTPELEDWMDSLRSEALALFGEVCVDAGIPAPQFPGSFWGRPPHRTRHRAPPPRPGDRPEHG
jgi:hypothetical protein